VAGNSVSILVVIPGPTAAEDRTDDAPDRLELEVETPWAGWEVERFLACAGEEGEPVEELDRDTSSSRGSCNRSLSQGGGVLICGCPGASSTPVCNTQQNNIKNNNIII
jgi:hypothetical protein